VPIGVIMSILPAVLQAIAVSKVKDVLSKDNLNPIKTPSTGVAYTTSGALAYLLANPPGTEHDLTLQIISAILAVVSFVYRKKSK
jgi:hypothetical protein